MQHIIVGIVKEETGLMQYQSQVQSTDAFLTRSIELFLQGHLAVSGNY